MSHQQIVTFEETFQHLNPGGVYLCEDVHGDEHEYADYMLGLARNLNSVERYMGQAADGTPGSSCTATSFQRNIHSIHLYPFVVTVERHDARPEHLSAPKHGTEGQPFL
jgi:hypothetical protein